MHSPLRWSSLVLCAGIFIGTQALAQTPPADSPPPPAETPPPPPPPVEAAPPPSMPPPVDATPAAVPAPAVAAVVPTPMVPAPQAPMKIEAPNGSSIKFGLLAQPQYEALGSNALDKYAQNLYLRRLRILVGGTLFGVIDYFVETDFPNLFKDVNVEPAGMPGVVAKNTPGVNIQDAFVTYKPMGDLLKVDVGYMLPPMSHNAIQGAATLYGWDYYAFTFRHSDAFGSLSATNASPVGRDLGLELRGLVLGGHLEYRAGLFQGFRNAPTATEVGSRNFFRVMARAQINFLDAEPGFFYAGTYFGTKKIASIGGSYDFQDNYKYFSVDGLLDMPAGPGVVTAQVNFSSWDGRTFINLPKETAIQGEAGYNIAALQLSPIIRYEHLSSLTTAAGVNVTPINRYALGVAFWPYGHNSNLKAFYTRIAQNGTAHGANQINLQWQVYFF